MLLNSAMTLTFKKNLNISDLSGAKKIISILADEKSKIQERSERIYNSAPEPRITFLALKYGPSGYTRNEYQFIR